MKRAVRGENDRLSESSVDAVPVNNVIRFRTFEESREVRWQEVTREAAERVTC